MAKRTKCTLCELMLDKDAIGLTKKLLDKNAKKFYCLDCLANYLDVSTDDLYAKLEEFKEQGCVLF